MKKEECPECGGELCFRTNETYCVSCGLVVDDSPIYFGKDDYNKENSRNSQSRTGPQVTYLNPCIWTVY